LELKQMKIPILVEPTDDQRFRATGGSPLLGSVEADTADEAVEKLRDMIEDRLAKGAQIASIEIPDGDNPWMAGAGMFRDDTLYDDWQQAIADYRREANEMADAP
jgi:hypothetical protein